MALSTPNLSVEIAVSNMCLYPLDLRGMSSWRSNLAQLRPFLEQTGYRNFEIHPTQTIVEDAHARRLSGDTDVIDEIVGSLHQTFNDGRGPYGIAADLCRVQRRWASIGGMLAIQHALSRPVPSVHYPDWRGIHIPAHPRQDLPGYPGSFPIVQPKPELYRNFRISNPEKLAEAVGSAGIIGICEDTVHSREMAKDGSPSPRWQDIWPWRFASGDVYQMHVSADRADLKKQDRKLALKSQQELQAFTRGDWKDVENTDLSAMIIQGIENWVPPKELLKSVGPPVLRMVVEIPPRPKAALRRIEDHRRFIATLTELVIEAGATPLLYGDKIPTIATEV